MHTPRFSFMACLPGSTDLDGTSCLFALGWVPQVGFHEPPGLPVLLSWGRERGLGPGVCPAPGSFHASTATELPSRGGPCLNALPAVAPRSLARGATAMTREFLSSRILFWVRLQDADFCQEPPLLHCTHYFPSGCQSCCPDLQLLPDPTRSHKKREKHFPSCSGNEREKPVPSWEADCLFPVEDTASR